MRSCSQGINGYEQMEEKGLERCQTKLTASYTVGQLIKLIMNFISANNFETMKTREARVHLEHNLGYF